VLFVRTYILLECPKTESKGTSVNTGGRAENATDVQQKMEEKVLICGAAMTVMLIMIKTLEV
jgi:hypothetical protein